MKGGRGLPAECKTQATARAGRPISAGAYSWGRAGRSPWRRQTQIRCVRHCPPGNHGHSFTRWVSAPGTASIVAVQRRVTSPLFYGQATRAQRGTATWPGSHSHQEAEPGSLSWFPVPGLLWPQTFRVGGPGEGREANSLGSVCVSPRPPSSWERGLAALSSKTLTTKTGWERSHHPIPSSCPDASWCPWAEGAWGSAACLGHELCGRLREAEGGHSLSALLRVLRIEPRGTATTLPALASHNGGFVRVPPPAAFFPPTKAPTPMWSPAGGREVGQPGWSERWVALSLEQGPG